MKIATVVVHYKLDGLTNKCLDYLLAQTYPHDIIVLDNHSPEPFLSDRVPILRRHDGSDLAAGFNYATHFLGNYDWVWHFTNDVFAPPNTLESMVRVIRNRWDMAAIQPAMPSSHPHLCPKPEGGTADVRYLEWAAAMVNMTAWRDIGPLDEGFAFFSMDIDWSQRARKRGWKLVVDYNVQCEHEGRGTHDPIKFSISEQGKKENAYGKIKYKREDWQEFLLGKVE